MIAVPSVAAVVPESRMTNKPSNCGGGSKCEHKDHQYHVQTRRWNQSHRSQAVVGRQ